MTFNIPRLTSISRYSDRSYIRRNDGQRKQIIRALAWQSLRLMSILYPKPIAITDINYNFHILHKQRLVYPTVLTYT